MTTATWTGPVRHTDDASFRSTGQLLSAKLAAVGLVQTADTGQIDWLTVSRPGATNTEAGFEIWRFDDALQATAPIYLRIGYGTTTQANSFRIQIQVGTGTNGAGTLTGTTTTNTTCVLNNGNAVAGNYGNFLCYVEGHVGLMFMATPLTSSANYGWFAVTRTCDSSGAPTAHGCFLFSRGQSGTPGMRMSCLRFASVAAKTVDLVTGYSSLLPGNISSSLENGEYQAFVAWGAFKEVLPCFGVCGVLNSELPLASTFEVALVGGTKRRYIAIGPDMGTISTGIYGAMLWE